MKVLSFWIVLAIFYYILSLISFKTYKSIKNAEIKIKISNAKGEKYIDLKKFFEQITIIDFIGFSLATLAVVISYFCYE
jgi:hypothetical protein